ncbi:PTS beta-glucoside transporter subunit IIBC [Loigolactobacillus coryniformis subsp. coryniformis]|uniref:Ascorbate-specific PTS system EIIC component n=1 Tax=Loigolactobacillus coryniformis subsp. coryniformis KCTC 3167 = DSM 20001 TaxID=913848 RepID=A0A0R1EZB1_9LACO|nr:PTS ascorbate transporter subunit IIC [Loigolactobacillus coryniformis]ATO56338.1 PTS ascorbate transporter subunit IIC [Loigolactobacillus coryniformis subsp. coryniformis KCTC 3167 = DSM 20001]KRK14816.1 PTS system ascorbate-specific transporter subunit IIC [Loigolactobacillus coryniformis subsp. coryniformis KCTC 3167 = DSM 20001]OEH89799.1 PTS beta-glucoside transporter subunit IIBC [Loigolactobacillus coryniformis subsp. coryniformis]
MNGILDLVVDLLSSAAIMVGLISFIGLVVQKETPTKVINGTIKTIVGFLVFGVGSAAATTALNSFQELFAKGLHLQGVLPLAEAVTALAQQRFGTVVALVMSLGFVFNLLFARFTPMKYIFLTGQHNLYLAALCTIMLKSVGLSNTWIIGLGGVIVGFMSAAMPAIAQPGMRKITGGDDIALGHYVSIGYALSSWLGGKVGDPDDSTEKLKLPGWLSIFKDYVIGVSITMVIFYYIAAFAAGPAQVEKLSGGVSWLVYPLLQGLQFSAALYVIITGVRLLLGEIVNAFVGISEKLIPNAKPALDVPVVFPYAPTATVIGFISAYVAGLLMMFVFAALHMPVIIPVAVPYFFIGATAGVFGNATGGWKGCVIGSFVIGILIAVGPSIVYPVLASVGLKGTAFPEIDFNVVALVIKYIGQFVQSIF